MRYATTRDAEFVSRENRFVATVLIDGEEVCVHVKNTGRCGEILRPGTRVVLSASDSPGRRYGYDLVAAWKGDLLINIDSQAPNRVFSEYLSRTEPFGPGPVVSPECTHGDSRFDFYIEAGDRRIFAEVKGVTQETDGVCMFPMPPPSAAGSISAAWRNASQRVTRPSPCSSFRCPACACSRRTVTPTLHSPKPWSMPSARA